MDTTINRNGNPRWCVIEKICQQFAFFYISLAIAHSTSNEYAVKSEVDLQLFLRICKKRCTESLMTSMCHFSVLCGYFWLCRKCGASIAKTTDFINIPSSHALQRRNASFHHNITTLIQTFKNPNGHIFELITLTDSEAIDATHQYMSDTWFMDYSWSVSVCPSCHQHLGWIYHAKVTDTRGLPNQFHGLILQNLLQEEEASAVIHIPKSFGS